MISKKQTIFDFFRENNARIQDYHAVVSFDVIKEVLVIKYPSGFTWELWGTDFPTRDFIPVYRRVKGKYILDHYESESKRCANVEVEHAIHA